MNIREQKSEYYGEKYHLKRRKNTSGNQQNECIRIVTKTGKTATLQITAQKYNMEAPIAVETNS